MRAVLACVDAPARLGHALEAGDHALAVGTVLERHHQRVVYLALVHLEALDVALLLEDARDLPAHAGAGHLDELVERQVGVPQARQHVCDRISDHLLTSGSWSCPPQNPGARAPGAGSASRRPAGRSRGPGAT